MSISRRIEIVVALIAAIAAAFVLAGCGSSSPAAPAAPSPAAPAAASSTTAPPSPAGPTITRTVTWVVFRVRGDAGPGGADITYGSDSNSISPPGGLGFDGTGTAAPFTASVKYRARALYYVINAQLQGSGDITCSVSVKVTAHYSDGTHLSRSKVLARGHASGGYNICDAQAGN